VSEVALADYLAHCFREAVRAREMVDAYSRDLAQTYAQDPVLKEFPVPRFRTPKLTFVVPVLVTDARFEQRSRFDMDVGEFVEHLTSRADQVRRSVEAGRDDWTGGRGRDRRRRDVGTDTVEAVRAFHEELVANPDPTRPDEIVTIWWHTIFERVLQESELLSRSEDRAELLRLRATTTNEVLELVRSRTAVERTTISSLFVDPLTSTVRRESSEASVFTVTAELVEEGFYLRSITDEGTGETRPVVDFE
jgi:hypothetical protein